MGVSDEDSTVIVVDSPLEFYSANAGIYDIALVWRRYTDKPPVLWYCLLSQLYNTIKEFPTYHGFYRAQYSIWHGRRHCHVGQERCRFVVRSILDTLGSSRSIR